MFGVINVWSGGICNFGSRVMDDMRECGISEVAGMLGGGLEFGILLGEVLAMSALLAGITGYASTSG
jgi:hypothetical protein